jgi:peptidoglycan/LPS O-acetylase OafA/YrhL
MKTLPRQRWPLIDILKGFACQFIVLHHLAFYGPMSDATAQLWPQLVSWFSQDARWAVQVFLVVSGFLTAKALASPSFLLHSPQHYILKRYGHIVLPYVASLGLAWVCTQVAAEWLVHDSIPSPVSFWGFLAHASLLHGVLGVDSMSAGVWYVAIDFQLYALSVLLMWVCVRWRRTATRSRHFLSAWQLWLVCVAGLGLLSLLYFNLHPQWDDWALYFWGSYALGCLAYAVSRENRRHVAFRWLIILMVCAGLALATQFRERLVLAALVATGLAIGMRQDVQHRIPNLPAIQALGRMSYSIFLVNFPVSLVVNAVFQRFISHDAISQTIGVALAGLLCNAVGWLFFQTVEMPLRQLKVPTSWRQAWPWWVAGGALYMAVMSY